MDPRKLFNSIKSGDIQGITDCLDAGGVRRAVTESDDGEFLTSKIKSSVDGDITLKESVDGSELSTITLEQETLKRICREFYEKGFYDGDNGRSGFWGDPEFFYDAFGEVFPDGIGDF